VRVLEQTHGLIAVLICTQVGLTIDEQYNWNLPSNIWKKSMVAIESRIQCILYPTKETLGKVGMACRYR
jgi:hypothetical protein